MKIKKISAYLRNDAHFQFYTEFYRLVDKAGAENLGIAAQFSTNSTRK